MAGSYCYYPVSTPPPAMRGYGWLAETLGVLAQVGATVYGIDAQKRMATEARHAQERALAAAAQQQAEAQQYAQQQAVIAMSSATTAQSGGPGVAAQLGAVPTWVWGAGAAGVAAVVLWKVVRR